MSKDPAFLFYSSDFITGTLFFTDEQVGKYIRLLCMQHQQGHLEKEDMLNICKPYDKKVFNKFVIDDNGLYYNQRLEDETIKRKKYSESRRNNRLGKDKKGHMKDTCKTHVKHMVNENENEDISKDLKEDKVKKKKVIKHKYGEYGHVLLADNEVEKLKVKFNSHYESHIKNLDEAIEQHGYKYNSHYLTILKWDRKDKDKNGQGNIRQGFGFSNESVEEGKAAGIKTIG